MNGEPEADVVGTGDGPSLRALRVAAGVGLLTAVVLVVVGFQISVWLGLGAIFVSPLLPMVFVLAVEALRPG